jgi:hypothetical protein
MRLALLSCEVFYRECCALIARSPHQIDVRFLPKGLHDLGCKGMRGRMQAALDAIVAEQKYEAILLGYGLCNNGLTELEAHAIPLILPRSHDCIGIFMGSRERYLKYFKDHPGVYFTTSGWLERGKAEGELNQLSVQHQSGMDSSYEELVRKYGEDNAKFLFEELCQHARNYGQYTFIEMGIEPDERFAQETQEKARQRGWEYRKLPGDMSLLARLINGDWNDTEFLVVPPGHRIAATNEHDRIVKAVPIEPPAVAPLPANHSARVAP